MKFSTGKTAYSILLGSLLLVGAGKTIQPLQKPNVLFVVFDDLNDWEGCLSGHSQAFTPNINKLSEKGVLFTNAHCNGTMCCPSRASMITGLRPTTTGVYKNTDTPLDLYKEKQTLNKHFKENGYYVAGAGKILHKFFYQEEDWHEFYGRRKEPGVISNRSHPNEEEVTSVSGNIAWGGYDVPDSLTFDGRSVDWVRERINRDHDKPFFLACGIFRPHIPWFNPQKYFDIYALDSIQLPDVRENDLNDIPLSGKQVAYSITNYTKNYDLSNTENKEYEKMIDEGLWDDAVRAYLASVSYADAQFGRLLETLENSNYAKNTIIVLWSDHGWHLGEKEHWRKATLWEEVTRIPLIVYAPGKSTNQECSQPVSLVDLYPTLVELCGLPEVEGLEGESLVPQLNNPETVRTTPAISSLTPDFHAIRDERYRYITYGNGEEELYDHFADPEEWTNVADDPDYKVEKERLKSFVPTNNKAPVKGIYNADNEK